MSTLEESQQRFRCLDCLVLRLDDEVMLASTGGVLIRTPVREVSSQGRDATGVRVMNLDEGHSVATAALVELDDEV